ncbi:hypothetical protein GZH46_03119, partial [Fragariocoptes setiger]
KKIKARKTSAQLVTETDAGLSSLRIDDELPPQSSPEPCDNVTLSLVHDSSPHDDDTAAVSLSIRRLEESTIDADISLRNCSKSRLSISRSTTQDSETTAFLADDQAAPPYAKESTNIDDSTTVTGPTERRGSIYFDPPTTIGDGESSWYSASSEPFPIESTQGSLEQLKRAESLENERKPGSKE